MLYYYAFERLWHFSAQISSKSIKLYDCVERPHSFPHHFGSSCVSLLLRPVGWIAARGPQLHHLVSAIMHRRKQQFRGTASTPKNIGHAGQDTPPPPPVRPSRAVPAFNSQNTARSYSQTVWWTIPERVVAEEWDYTKCFDCCPFLFPSFWSKLGMHEESKVDDVRGRG